MDSIDDRAQAGPRRFPPRPGIERIDPYVGGESALEGVRTPLKLSSNENPLGPSPRAIEAYRATAARLAIYPSSDHAALRAAIAEVHGLDPERIVCGAGSDELIALLCRAYAGPGDEVIHTEHGFAMYRISALAAGAEPVEVPERERVTDVEAILAAAGPRTRLVFLANPNNPTGTMVAEAELERLARGLPEHTLLVIDGAYAEYVAGCDGGAALVERLGNVVMTRTFSKIHGLGGLRVGWAYAPAEVVDVLNRIRGPFNVSAPALAAAEAAVHDTAWVEHCRAENARQRARLEAGLRQLGIAVDPSQANFVLARFADEAEALAADRALRARGIIVRRVAGYGFPEALRITVGDEEAVGRVLAALADWRAGAAA